MSEPTTESESTTSMAIDDEAPYTPKEGLVRDRPPKGKTSCYHVQSVSKWQREKAWPCLSTRLTVADLDYMITQDELFVETAYGEATGKLKVDEEGREWHVFHSDPGDEVIIKSNDEVFFRANKFRLGIQSSFFNGLLDLSKPEGAKINSAQHPIELPFPQITIANYLDLVNSESSRPPTVWYLCDDILEIAAFTDSCRIHKRTWTTLVVDIARK